MSFLRKGAIFFKLKVKFFTSLYSLFFGISDELSVTVAFRLKVSESAFISCESSCVSIFSTVMSSEETMLTRLRKEMERSSELEKCLT